MSVPLTIASNQFHLGGGPSVIRGLGPTARAALNIDQLGKRKLDDSTGDINADDNRHVERC